MTVHPSITRSSIPHGPSASHQRFRVGREGNGARTFTACIGRTIISVRPRNRGTGLNASQRATLRALDEAVRATWGVSVSATDVALRLPQAARYHDAEGCFTEHATRGLHKLGFSRVMELHRLVLDVVEPHGYYCSARVSAKGRTALAQLRAA